MVPMRFLQDYKRVVRGMVGRGIGIPIVATNVSGPTTGIFTFTVCTIRNRRDVIIYGENVGRGGL